MIKEKINNDTPKSGPKVSYENSFYKYDAYSCPYCSTLPEILYFNEINSTVKFKCQKHGENTLFIQEYLEKMINWVNISDLKSKNKCSIHNDVYSFYCKDCEENICQKCLKETQKHDKHIKYKISDLNPSKREMIILKEKISIWSQKKEELNHQIKNLNDKIIFYDALINSYQRQSSNYFLNINLKHLLFGEKINQDFIKNAEFIKFKTEKSELEDFVKNHFLVATKNVDKLNLMNKGIGEQVITELIKGIEDKTVFRILKFSGKIQNPSEVIELKGIKILDLSGNNISNIDFLANKVFPNLEILNLNNNEINSIDVLKNVTCPVLKEIHLKKNNINNIDILQELNITKLKILWLSNNKIESIDVFQKVKFPQLLKLGLNKNKIKDISVFDKKRARFPQLFELYIHGNEIDVKAFFRIVKDLYNRVREFYY